MQMLWFISAHWCFQKIICSGLALWWSDTPRCMLFCCEIISGTEVTWIVPMLPNITVNCYIFWANHVIKKWFWIRMYYKTYNVVKFSGYLFLLFRGDNVAMMFSKIRIQLITQGLRALWILRRYWSNGNTGL